MTPDEAFEVVRRSRANGRMPHAYIVVGDPRAAGLDFSRRVSALLLCGDEAAAPCGECDACRRVREGSHPDVLSLDPEKKSRVIGIEALREIFLPWCSKMSFVGGWKVGCIFFADRLNEAAANAFLKMLEEPPPSTLFLLVTDRPDALLPTIRSRCQTLDLASGRTQPPPEPWRTRVAEILRVHAAGVQLVASATASRLQALFDEMGDLAEEQVRERLRASDADPNAAPPDAETVKALVGAREHELRQAVYESMQDWYRDLVVLSVGGAAAPLRYAEYREDLEKKARAIPGATALRLMDGLQKIRTLVEDRNVRPVSAVFSYYFLFLP